MKTVIYQYWDGVERPGNMAGLEAMKMYADRIGADHIYELNPKLQKDLGQYSPHYGKFKPIYDDKFADYYYIMYVDCDVVPTLNCTDINCTENIFEEFAATGCEIGICEEINAPKTRKNFTIGGGINNANDEKWVNLIEKKWPVKMPRTNDGLPRVYNSGMLIFSKKGLRKAREKFFDFAKYVNFITVFKLPAFYTCDQPYVHAMLEVCGFDWTTMPYKWNSSVHYDPGVKTKPRPVIDLRNNANFVHVQLNGADDWDADKIHRVVNLPRKEWNL